MKNELWKFNSPACEAACCAPLRTVKMTSHNVQIFTMFTDYVYTQLHTFTRSSTTINTSRNWKVEPHVPMLIPRSFSYSVLQWHPIPVEEETKFIGILYDRNLFSFPQTPFEGLKPKPNKALDENSSLSYGTSLAIRDHTVLPATRHNWTRSTLTPAGKLVLDLPTPEGWKVELTWAIRQCTGRESNPRSTDHVSDALPLHYRDIHQGS